MAAKAGIGLTSVFVALCVLFAANYFKFHWGLQSPLNTSGTPTVSTDIERANKHLGAHLETPPEKNSKGDCTYIKSPETTAHVGDAYLDSYPYKMSSLIIKDTRSTELRPFHNLELWMKETGEKMTINERPFYGAYVVELDSPRSARELAVIIERLFHRDGPQKEPSNQSAKETATERCHLDFAEINYIFDEMSGIKHLRPHRPFTNQPEPSVNGGDSEDPTVSMDIKILNKFYPTKAPPIDSSGPIDWDWLGGKFSENANIKSESYGSNFVDAWVEIKDWIKLNKLGWKPTTIPIAVVDSPMLKSTEEPSLHNVKFREYITITDNSDPVITDGKCSFLDSEFCHGEAVASVLAADTNTGKTQGNPGALGIGVNYGEMDTNGVSRFPITAVQAFGLKGQIFVYNEPAYFDKHIKPYIGSFGGGKADRKKDLSGVLRGLDAAIFGTQPDQNSKYDGTHVIPKARVVNISFGDGNVPCSIFSERYLEKMNERTNNKVVIVMGTSNIKTSLKEAHRGSLAGCKDVIAAVAHDRIGSPIPGASTGLDENLVNRPNSMPISAPGVAIHLLAKFQDYDFVNGSSFATPQVSAAVALMLFINPLLTSAEISDILNSTGIAAKTTGGKPRIGNALNAGAAVKRVMDDLNAKYVAVGIPPVVSHH